MSLKPTLRLRWAHCSTRGGDLADQNVPASVNPVRFDPATGSYVDRLVYLQQCFTDENGGEHWLDVPVGAED